MCILLFLYLTHVKPKIFTITACNCNLHSTKCIFSKELYDQSGRLTGGVCVNCRHNTAGTNCQNCADGYYRDLSVPLTHRQACKGKTSVNCITHKPEFLLQHAIVTTTRRCACSINSCSCFLGRSLVECV